ncbi:MAG: CHASE2 domain-containing protein [Lewinella sp.]|nr:CHASE2 domain-containing protein [Lewinella sp.]
MKNRRTRWIWLLATVNALLMLVLTFHWLSLPYTFGDESFLIKWTSLAKKSLLHIDPKPAPESVLFVDISESKTTLPKTNEFGEPSDFHRYVVTDRRHLSAFLEMVSPYADETRLIVLDVLFSEPSPYDSLLQAQVDLLGDKILGVSHLEAGRELVQPVINMPNAVATYRSAQGLFLKYPLVMGDSLPTVPLAMYQRLHQARFRQGRLFEWINGGITLPAPVVDFKVRPTDFQVNTDLSESSFAIYNLGTLLELRDLMQPEDWAELFRNKVIMVGDFVNDIHQTPFGKMPGLLLVYNAYLTLAARDNVVSVFWVFLLLGGYWFMSWRVLTGKRVTQPRWLVKVFQSKVGQIILNALDEAFLLIAITILSYMLFNIHINILILLVYIKTVEYLWLQLRTFLSKRRQAPKPTPT